MTMVLLNVFEAIFTFFLFSWTFSDIFFNFSHFQPNLTLILSAKKRRRRNICLASKSKKVAISLNTLSLIIFIRRLSLSENNLQNSYKRNDVVLCWWRVFAASHGGIFKWLDAEKKLPLQFFRCIRFASQNCDLNPYFKHRNSWRNLLKVPLNTFRKRKIKIRGVI